MKLPLPAETREYFRDDKNLVLKISNLGLLFNKYVFSWQNDWQMEAKEFREDITKQRFTNDQASAVYRRQKSAADGMKLSGYQVEFFEAVSDSRFIIGLGGTSVIETGMTLHPLYGFPYLPASGLKGLARAYAEIGCDAPKEELFAVFGSEDKESRNAVNNQQGNVFFMDGLPVTFPSLELDIMNPHYGEYYQGDKPPADYLNPKPITFLTVAPGQTFSFAVYSRDKGLAVKAKEWLMGGLEELGTGGKTNVGYGYFKVNTSQSISSSGVQSSNAGQTSAFTITSEEIIWENASLTWTPGNMTLTATKDNKKAEIKLGNEKEIVPERLHNRLFEKKKTVTANVKVEAIGNFFRIVKIEVS